MLKTKPKKERNHSSIETVDTTHKKFILKFKKRKEELPKTKDKLKKLEKKLNDINNMKKDLYTHDIISKRAQLKVDIEFYKKEIYDIENNISELNYYSNTEDLLSEYYNIVEDEKIINNDNNQEVKLYDISERCIKENELNDLDKLNLENKKNNKKKIKKQSKTRYKKTIQLQNKRKNFSIQDFFSSNTKTSSKNSKKATILDKFLTIVDNNYNTVKYNSKKDIIKCKTCNSEKKPIASDGFCVCLNCGECEPIIIESDKPNYKDPIPEKSGYPYKRQNHFQELISRFQAKESTEIPKEVFDKIIIELKKQKIYDRSTINLAKMKEILKKLSLNNYYEHIPHIISKLTGIPPPTISRETESTLKIMFKDIQKPFEKHCPKDRVNFLSYSYVLHKFCQLLELDHLLEHFPLLKNRDKLRQQDNIWKNICADLRWEYISSV